MLWTITLFKIIPFVFATQSTFAISYASEFSLAPLTLRADGEVPANATTNSSTTSSPLVRGSGRWENAVAKAKRLVAQLSLDEKVNLTTGVGWQGGRCVGNIAPNPRIGFPGLCLEDSPLGVRFADFVSAFPAGINAAATFDRELMRERGKAIGREFRGKGVNVALGPMMNIGRVAEGGRNWEGFGADPYLAGEAAYETIQGLQSHGVQACAKHYINNEQDHNRTMESSNVDDRTEHEIYAHPFLRSVAAGVASIMCSYNLVNGTYACENNDTLNRILKHEIGFQGYVMSDWSATESTISAEAGLDMTMPGDITFNSGTSYFGANLTAYVQNGKISEDRVTDMATRIIAAWYLLGQDVNYPPVNFDAFNLNDPFNEHVDVQHDHHQLIRKMGAVSTVLLKNNNHTLPLTWKPRSIALIGSDAGPPFNGPNGYSDRGGVSGTLAMGWGSGTSNFPYLISPLEAIQARGRRERTSISWFLDDFDTTSASQTAAFTDVAVVFVNSDSGEGYITVDGNEGDRKNLTAWHGGDDLILSVAAVNRRTVVVVHSVGPLILESWIEHPNVTAVLWAGLPGQESGHSLVDILYGEYSPSGRLPYTIAKSVDDYPTSIITNNDSTVQVQVNYTEGLNVDYRYFDAHNITPRYEFGYGLSYTKFAYSNLSIQKTALDESHSEKRWAKGKVSSHAVGASLADWLHSPYYNVTFQIKNVGHVYGCEIPQLYISLPNSTQSPPYILRGFTRASLSPEKSKTVSLTLSRYDLSIWDVVQQGWIKPQGKMKLTVGSSSRDHKLHGYLH